MTRVTRIRNFTLDVGLAIAEGTPEGDAAFRNAIFGESSNANPGRAAGPQRISDRAALSLGNAFMAKSGVIGATLPFAHMCLEHGRADLLREVLAAERPSVVQEGADLRNVQCDPDWLRFLCSKVTSGMRYYGYSLIAAATGPMGPHAADFIELVLETGGERRNIEFALSNGGRAAALITEVQMKMRMREVQAALPTETTAAAPTTPERAAPKRRAVNV